MSSPDYYWERIKDIHKFFFGSLAFLFVTAGVFGDGALAGLAALLFLVAIGVGPFAFVYYAYKDKQQLATRHTGVNERHWLTIAVFMWLTSGIYAFVYTGIRAMRYDQVNPNRSESGPRRLLTAGQSIAKRFSDETDTTEATQQSSSRDTTSSASSSSGSSTSGSTPPGSSPSSPSSSNRSQGSGSSSSDDGSDTNLYVSDTGEDNNGNTQVYDPTADSTSSSPSETSSQTASSRSAESSSRFCSYCGIDLRPHNDPTFCPECGTKSE